MNDIDNEELVYLIMQNKNLIYSLANRFCNHCCKEDLYQVGVIGLINAYHNFDSQRGCKFSTYAFPYILGEIKKYVREDMGLKISRDIIYLCSRIEKARELITHNLNRNPTISELSSHLEIEEDKIVEALQVNLFIKSLDEPINDEGKTLTISDSIFKEERVDKLDLISLRDELSRLSSDERLLLEFRYLQDKTQQETANIMGITQVQVSRGEQKALGKLRQRMYH